MKTLYYNGTILTMEKPLVAEAVLTEDGVIKKAGGLSSVMELAKDARRIDLKGHTMLPAFIDAHSHFSAYANSFLQVPLEEADSFQDIQKGISAFLQKNKVPPGKWVVAGGYDQTRLKEQTHPGKEVLDQVSGDHPVVLKHRSGHVGVFNTKALQILQVTGDTLAPAGGFLEVRNGAPTGYMEENAFLQYLNQVPMPSPQELLGAYEKAQQAYGARGITMVQEGMTPPALLPFYKKLLEENRLKLDVAAYLDEKSFPVYPKEWEEYRGTGKNHFRISGYKIFLDGSPQGETAWMRQEYESRPGYSGYPALSDEEVYKLCRRAVQENMQLLAHCNGDGACEQFIKTMERLKEEGMDPAKIRPVMVHAQFLGTDQIPRLSKVGILPSFFTAHSYYWGDVHLKNFGRERAFHLSPAGSALKEGLVFTFHQDAPVIEPDMLETIWCGVNRKTKSGLILGKEEGISVLEALRAVTSNAAYQYFEEKSRGSIAPGKAADFVVLEKNPLEAMGEELKDISILETIKDGKTIYTRP